ncbi:MAG: hypothetical protein KIT57_08985 [Blastocatellales bacterium]|nr:hypothetical protein [Blastocatellales bacterium]
MRPGRVCFEAIPGPLPMISINHQPAIGILRPTSLDQYQRINIYRLTSAG